MRMFNVNFITKTLIIFIRVDEADELRNVLENNVSLDFKDVIKYIVF